MSHPLTSIVILTRNELEYTQRCIASIQCHTPEPYELVFVDNGSDDGSVEWLRSLPGAIVLANEENAGFGGGCNQGIAVSNGERILLLNNDVVVTPGWLGALHRELNSGPDVGVSGPRSNRVAGEQVVLDVTYDAETLDGLADFTRSWVAPRAGTGHDAVRLIGFCMLFRREVLEQVGGFDLRYGIGNFEDDDICLRTAIAGWRLRIADDCFIHHFGSRTFIGQKVDYSATMQENFARFASRWELRPEEVDAAGSYDSRAVVRRTPFDARSHYAPIIGVPSAAGSTVQFDGRGTSLLATCDRHDPEATAELLAGALGALGPADDVTVVVRIDPRDATSMVLLESAADAAEAAGGLPDVVLVEAADDDDTAAIIACDLTLVHGRGAWARAANARWAGRVPVTLRDLAAGIDQAPVAAA